MLILKCAVDNQIEKPENINKAKSVYLDLDLYSIYEICKFINTYNNLSEFDKEKNLMNIYQFCYKCIKLFKDNYTSRTKPLKLIFKFIQWFFKFVNTKVLDTDNFKDNSIKYEKALTFYKPFKNKSPDYNFLYNQIFKVYKFLISIEKQVVQNFSIKCDISNIKYTDIQVENILKEHKTSIPCKTFKKRCFFRTLKRIYKKFNMLSLQNIYNFFVCYQKLPQHIKENIDSFVFSCQEFPLHAKDNLKNSYKSCIECIEMLNNSKESEYPQQNTALDLLLDSNSELSNKLTECIFNLNYFFNFFNENFLNFKNISSSKNYSYMFRMLHNNFIKIENEILKKAPNFINKCMKKFTYTYNNYKSLEVKKYFKIDLLDLEKYFEIILKNINKFMEFDIKELKDVYLICKENIKIIHIHQIKELLKNKLKSLDDICIFIEDYNNLEKSPKKTNMKIIFDFCCKCQDLFENDQELYDLRVRPDVKSDEFKQLKNTFQYIEMYISYFQDRFLNIEKFNGNFQNYNKLSEIYMLYIQIEKEFLKKFPRLVDSVMSYFVDYNELSGEQNEMDEIENFQLYLNLTKCRIPDNILYKDIDVMLKKSIEILRITYEKELLIEEDKINRAEEKYKKLIAENRRKKEINCKK